MSAEILRVRGLSVSYRDAAALSDVDLDVVPGEVLAVLGPSGSGKSTLLHTLAGFRDPDAGEVWLDGRLVASATVSEPPERRNVAMVFQNYALWPHLSALDTVAYPLRRRGARRTDARREAMQILELLHVDRLADRRPAELSGGEQQRVGLARALACRSPLYLFDEPTAHLDTHVRGVFLEELVSRQRATGAAALYATHDAQEALGLADRVMLVTAGRVVQVGTPEEVYNRPADQWAARLTGPVSVLTDGNGAPGLLVRPEWASLGGDRAGNVRGVWFRGPHTDYLLDTGQGRLLLRETGPPTRRRGDQVGWTLHRSWSLPAPMGRPGQVPSRVAGPE